MRHVAAALHKDDKMKDSPALQPVWLALAVAATLALGACSTSAPSSSGASAAPGAAASSGYAKAAGIQSIARLEATKGSSVSGVIQFFPQTDGSVRVQGSVSGLAPNTEHGFHIHEKGDCSSGDGLSAMGHFNPGQQAHGKAGSTGAHHVGDLPSLVADTQGVAKVDFVTRAFTLDRESNGVLGRGLIVHNDPDDYTTQPTGNSGARLACAVIQRGA